MPTLSLRGVFTALVTPFDEDISRIDWAAFEKLVAGQIEAGVAGLVPCGTTGETPTLSDAEQREIVQRTAALARGRLPILAGTGTNDTKKTIQLSRAALEAGADAVMIVNPYYSKPSQDGMVEHVAAVAREVTAPVVLYNIPGRSGVELSVESHLRILDRCPNVIAVKDATGNVLHCQELLRRAPDRITVLSGDDVLTLPMVSVGARGVISVTSNLYPREVADSVNDVLAGRFEAALLKQRRLLPVHRELFVEPNPQPIKAALALKQRMRASVRLPMLEASAATKQSLAEVMRVFEAA